jgi:hypothetical protein
MLRINTKHTSKKQKFAHPVPQTQHLSTNVIEASDIDCNCWRCHDRQLNGRCCCCYYCCQKTIVRRHARSGESEFFAVPIVIFCHQSVFRSMPSFSFSVCCFWSCTFSNKYMLLVIDDRCVWCVFENWLALFVFRRRCRCMSASSSTPPSCTRTNRFQRCLTSFLMVQRQRQTTPLRPGNTIDLCGCFVAFFSLDIHAKLPFFCV